MKIKQLAELLNVDIRRICRQKFKKDLDVATVSVLPLDGGDYHITLTVEMDGHLKMISFDYDCHGHLITVIE